MSEGSSDILQFAKAENVPDRAEVMRMIEDRKAPPPTLDINSPEMAEFKQSVLDEVAKKLAGETDKNPPADIPWTKIEKGIEIRLLNGYLEFKNNATFSKTTTHFVICNVPASFPPPADTCYFPAAAREIGVNAKFGYFSFTAGSKAVYFTPNSACDEVSMAGIRIKAQWL